MRIGVVTPAYNAEAWLGDAIRSVLGQSHRDWRMVVVDDGSNDGTADAAGRFQDPRLLLIRQPRAGVSAARNRGIAALDADSFLFLDADDILVTGALSSLAASLDSAPWAVAAAGACAIIEVSAPTIASSPPLLSMHAGRTPGLRPGRGDLLEALLVQNRFANGGHLLIRREAIREAGHFRDDLSYGEDWEYWTRVALQGEFEATWDNTAVLLVRRHSDGAYLRRARDPASFDACIAAIYGNPALVARFGSIRLARLRQRAEAENAWIIGRELMRHGEISDGISWMRRSVMAAPAIRRVALLGAAMACGSLPAQWRGPLRPYPLSPHAE